MALQIIAVTLSVILLTGMLFEIKRKRQIQQALALESNKLKSANHINNAIFKNIHAFILLVNKELTVLHTNYYERTGTLKTQEVKKIGDLLQCRNALSSKSGCGTHPFCASCPIRQTTLKAFEEKKSFSDLEATVEIKLNGNQETTCNTVISGTYLLLDGEENMVITVHDVTKQKRTEEELKIAKEKAEKANLSKSAFLANMSHEIRTPINAITGFSEILSYTNVEEEKTQYKEIIKMNADLLLQLVNDILDLSKIEAGTIDFTYTNIDINQLLSDLRQLFQMRIAHTEKNNKIEIITELGLSACLIKTDQNRLIQVLSNFIANAIKFTEAGNIRIGYQAKENELYFYVSDTGSGIPQDRLQDIFERFVKLNKEEKNGTGLGLAISKGIINKLGGRIGVESEIGKGSTFWFTLPLCPDCDLTERSNFLKSFN